MKCRVAIRSGQRGAAPPNKKRRYRLLQERIDRLMDGYQRGTRSLKNYWAAVAHAVHDFQ
jgi:DNA-binding ferritin-like protein (Dps family)